MIEYAKLFSAWQMHQLFISNSYKEYRDISFVFTLRKI